MPWRRPGQSGIVRGAMSKSTDQATISSRRTPVARERPARRARRGEHSRGARRFRLTGRDLELLGFVAAHRFVLAAHVESWLGTSSQFSYRRLLGLVEVGLLSHERIFHAQPGCYRVTNGGLAVIDSELPRPTIDLRTYGHDVGVVWLWLACRAGRFGQVERLFTEREMRSHDQSAKDFERNRFGVPVDGYDRAGRQRSHYPDLLGIKSEGGRLALELELTLKGRRRLENILVGYGGQSLIGRVIYVTGRPAVARALLSAGAELGLEQLIEVQTLPPAGLAALARGGEPGTLCWEAVS